MEISKFENRYKVQDRSNFDFREACTSAILMENDEPTIITMNTSTRNNLLLRLLKYVLLDILTAPPLPHRLPGRIGVQ